MTVILEHVVIICLGIPLPRRSYELVTFGLQFSKIAFLQFINATLVKPIIIRFDLILLLSIM
jgi:hypothetical protein